MRARSPTACSRVSSSGTSRAPSPTPSRSVSAASSSRTAGRSSSTRSGRGLPASKRSCCGCSRPASSRRWARRRRATPTSAWSRRRTSRSPTRSGACTFREDLLYRLNTVEAPTSRRSASTTRIFSSSRAHFLRVKARTATRKPITGGFSVDALDASSPSHPWPGNVRELEPVIERAVRARGRQDDRRSGPRARGAPRPKAGHAARADDARRGGGRSSIPQGDGLPNARQRRAKKAAEALGLSRSAIYRRLQALGYKVTE